MSSIVRRILVIGVLLACPVAARAQQAAASPQARLTLNELVDMALANNRLLKIADLDTAKAKNEANAARTRQWPNLGVQLFEGHLNTLDFTFAAGSLGTFPDAGPIPRTETKVSAESDLASVLSVQASQPLTQLRKVRAGVRQLDFEREVMEERRRGRAQTVVSEVRRLYYAILETDNALTSSEAAVTAYRELQRLTTERVNAQSAFPADLASVQAELAQREHSSLTLRNSLATLKQQLGLLVGRDLEPSVLLSAIEAAPALTIDLAAAQTRALGQRPDVREAELKVKQAEDRVREKRAERLPEVSAVVRFIGLKNITVLPTTITAFGIYATWEPFDWGRKRQDIAASGNLVAQASLALREAQSQARVDVDARYRQLEEARALVPVAELARSAAEQQLRLTRTRFEAQTAFQSDVLQAEAALAEAERAYRKALLATMTAEAELRRALGEM